MNKKLLPCIACKRHIRETESACPFCAATPAFLGLALLLSACDTPELSVAPVYGAPPINTPTSIATPENTPSSAPVSTPASAPTSATGSTVTPPPAKQPEKKAAPKAPPTQIEQPKNVPAYGGPRPNPKPDRDENRPLYGMPVIPDFEKDPRNR